MRVVECYSKTISYEPADITVHSSPPPPQKKQKKTIEDGFFFVMVSSAPKIFSSRINYILYEIFDLQCPQFNMCYVFLFY